jgi:hypothetical protein
MTDPADTTWPPSGRAPAQDIADRRTRRRRAVAASVAAFSLAVAANTVSGSSPAWLSFGMVCVEVLILIGFGVALLVAPGRGRVRILDLPAWFYPAAVISAAVLVTVSVSMLAI